MQLARLGLGIKHHHGLLQNSRFNLLVMFAQQVERAADVILSPQALGFAAGELSLVSRAPNVGLVPLR